ncbi:hypothetical protein [Rhizobium bangladeshense]|uniref:hypothetical protein n=1 Tax=Rhizobium bangladeshense TaxID=1138189 RepID=UPI001C83692F|nr:hypothetical protein [Rhizobium bangladeshense]MBX4898866.1 hypothetical protein [Rhizobium bangladeshense]MBY3616962.1 hypothetical protein [Rhizobium bangladeshense]
MGVDILSGDIGYKPLKAILLSVEYYAGLGAMLLTGIFLGAEEYAKFQRHVEPRRRRDAIGSRPRDVMNAITAFLDDPADLVKPVVGGIVGLERGSR